MLMIALLAITIECYLLKPIAGSLRMSFYRSHNPGPKILILSQRPLQAFPSGASTLVPVVCFPFQWAETF